MPIKGLSEKRRITRGGFLRLGEMVVSPKTGKEHPAKSDHFIPDFENPDLVPLFHKLYGEKPTRVSMSFASDNLDQVFPQYYKCYGASSGLKCKGDGERASRAIKTEDSVEFVEVDCIGPEECDFGKENGCDKIASLQFFIKGLPGIQVFQCNTGSYNSIVNLNSALEILQRLRAGKSIVGVWLTLVLSPQEAQHKGKKVQIYTLSLDIPVSFDEAQRLTSQFEEPAALPAPSDARDPLLRPPNGFAPDPEKRHDEPKTKPTKPETKPTNGDPLAEVKKIMAEVGWTNADMKVLLKKYYGGRTSRKLTEKELADLPEAVRAAASTSKTKPTEDGW